jgi:hypothetical protein
MSCPATTRRAPVASVVITATRNGRSSPPVGTFLSLLKSFGIGFPQNRTDVRQTRASFRLLCFERQGVNYGTTLLISEHTHARLTDPAAFHIRLIDRVKVKGRNSRLVDVFEVFNEDEPETLERKLANSGDFEQALSLYQQNQLDEARSLFEQCLNRCPGDPIARIYVNRCDRPMNRADAKSSTTEDADTGKPSFRVCTKGIG